MGQGKDQDEEAGGLAAPALAAVERGRWWPENTPEGQGLRTLTGAMPPVALAAVLALVEQLAHADASKPKDLDTTDPQGRSPGAGSASDG